MLWDGEMPQDLGNARAGFKVYGGERVCARLHNDRVELSDVVEIRGR
jgi:hypothetical protein